MPPGGPVFCGHPWEYYRLSGVRITYSPDVDRELFRHLARIRPSVPGPPSASVGPSIGRLFRRLGLFAPPGSPQPPRQLLAKIEAAVQARLRKCIAHGVVTVADGADWTMAGDVEGGNDSHSIAAAGQPGLVWPTWTAAWLRDSWWPKMENAFDPVTCTNLLLPPWQGVGEDAGVHEARLALIQEDEDFHTQAQKSNDARDAAIATQRARNLAAGRGSEAAQAGFLAHQPPAHSPDDVAEQTQDPLSAIPLHASEASHPRPGVQAAQQGHHHLRRVAESEGEALHREGRHQENLPPEALRRENRERETIQQEAGGVARQQSARDAQTDEVPVQRAAEVLSLPDAVREQRHEDHHNHQKDSTAAEVRIFEGQAQLQRQVDAPVFDEDMLRQLHDEFNAWCAVAFAQERHNNPTWQPPNEHTQTTQPSVPLTPAAGHGLDRREPESLAAKQASLPTPAVESGPAADTPSPKGTGIDAAGDAVIPASTAPVELATDPAPAELAASVLTCLGTEPDTFSLIDFASATAGVDLGVNPGPGVVELDATNTVAQPEMESHSLPAPNTPAPVGPRNVTSNHPQDQRPSRAHHDGYVLHDEEEEHPRLPEFDTPPAVHNIESPTRPNAADQTHCAPTMLEPINLGQNRSAGPVLHSDDPSSAINHRAGNNSLPHPLSPTQRLSPRIQQHPVAQPPRNSPSPTLSVPHAPAATVPTHLLYRRRPLPVDCPEALLQRAHRGLAHWDSKRSAAFANGDGASLVTAFLQTARWYAWLRQAV